MFVAKNVLTALRGHSTVAKNIPKQMKAVGLYKYLPITDPNSLLDLETEVPELQKSDVLVEVKAVAVNPYDAKQRAPKPNVEAKPRILGWDGSGVIVATGPDADLFKTGDEVFFTGDSRKNGCNAQYIALDQILVGNKPKTLTFEQAAALPVTALTAYDSLFDRLAITEKDKGKSLLIINSAGGVGSIASQLAKNIGLNVIGTASRPETVNFSKQFGADVVLNHTQDLLPQLETNGYKDGVDFILVNYDPLPYWDSLSKVIKPQGKICLLVESSGLVNITLLKDKSVTLVYEMMWTRVKHDTPDKYRHHAILQEVSKLVDEGKLKHTLTQTFSPINATNLREAHRLIETQRTVGKLILSGF